MCYYFGKTKSVSQARALLAAEADAAQKHGEEQEESEHAAGCMNGSGQSTLIDERKSA